MLPCHLLAQSTASVTIAPRGPSVTLPTSCQLFAAKFTNSNGVVRSVTFAWKVADTTNFVADTSGKVCLRGQSVAAPTNTVVTAKMTGRQLKDTTSFTVLPAPPPAVVMQPAPVTMSADRQRPTAIASQPPPAAVPATLTRIPRGDLATRNLPQGDAPGGLYAGSGSPISATISWTAATGATGYTVARSTSVAGHFDVVTATPVAATGITDTSLAPATTYFWVVTANYSNALPGTSAAISATTAIPKNPPDFAARAGQPGEIILNWSARSDAAYYLLEGDGITATQVNGTTISLPNLSAGARNFTLIAYFLGSGGTQYYADAAHPATARGAAAPKNTVPWLSKKGIGTTAEAAEYYNTIGATPLKDDLTKWKVANGFPAQGAAPDEVRARYFNAQDLNLGRDTHCRVASSHLACYQNNSGPEPGSADFPNADKALDDMVNGLPPFATVAMDQTANGTVNFYAYKKDGSLVQAAGLDNEGPKAMPNVCTACHGGRYDVSSNTVTGASFLPFDVFGFKFASAPGFSLNDQQEDFRQLNAMVKSTSPNSSNPNNPIVTFIDGMYGNSVGTPGTYASDNWVPAGWSAKPNVYDVFKRTCRTCHLALREGIDFTSSKQLTDTPGPVGIDVCGSGHSMPNAEVPYRKFWTQTTVYLPGYWSDPSVLGLTGGCP
jgi:hypothetical protein